ncbi:hypothetical protein AB0K27_22875 [Micromonospora echinospora]|uniref:Uncharacterized protein n=1 Tax=Micromonospora echinospora TaxID=1877 RepID=A0ABR6MEA6_MICEC|nr:hypothetical protein [Micromonospora echinospora]MBB5113711.1 hypothetical protein [Micromonospora echinospora]
MTGRFRFPIDVIALPVARDRYPAEAVVGDLVPTPGRPSGRS